MNNLFNRNNETPNNQHLYKDRELKRLNSLAEKIENLSKNLGYLSNEEIIRKTSEFKNRLKNGEKVYDMLPEAYALVSEAIYRQFGFKPHRVQLMGAISIFEGSGVEMKTGEGKTITGIFPAYLNALTEEPVHIMTSNDYLAGRDAETVKPVFNMLGMRVGSINSKLSKEEKKLAYQSDVVYGTTSNFGFDFLRDNLVYRKEDKVTNGLGFAIIDEADSLLLDQARTPLILSNTERISLKENELYKIATLFSNTLTIEDVEIDEDKKIATLKESGVDKALKFFGVDFDFLFDNYLYYINNAITAKFALENEVDYIVRNGKVVLVDKNTARPLPTHRFSEGLHQAVESKENVTISPESKVLGKITIQNFLSKYNRISGMSGTIKTSEEELSSIYGLDVVQIPTNKPMQRKDDTKFYFNAKEKYEAILRNVIETHKTGQPVLIGTISIEESEMLQNILKQLNIECNILNAKNLSEEAEIIANAGRFGAVTIATDMAGRGTDIKLGGNAEILAQVEARKGNNVSLEEIKKETKLNREKVISVGGLKVIGASLHNLVRVDDQLRGRAGRQGEVGESVFYTSLDDELFSDYPEIKDDLKSDFVKYLTTKNEKVKEKILKRIEEIQEINESVDFASRKSMLLFDKDPSIQYDEFYKLRDEILETDDISIVISNGANYLAENIVNCAINTSKNIELRDENFSRYKDIFDRFDFGNISFENIKETQKTELVKKLSSKILGSFNKNMLNGKGKATLLKNMDEAFINHLKNIEMAKKHLSISSFGDNNPILSFKEEVGRMYKEMIDSILPETLMELVEDTPKAFKFNKFIVPQKGM